jgi:Uma2 family endonuclease
MATQPAYSGWTYAEFARLPDDGNRYEVIAGELHMTPAPRPFHQDVVARLIVLLRGFADRHRLGRVLPAPVDVLLSADDYLEPDLVFVRRGRSDIITDRGVEGPPDLVVEVLSTSTALRDRGVKRDRYARFDIANYWIVDAERGQVEVYDLDEDPLRPAFVTAETLVWQPLPDGPPLTIDVRALVKPVD